MQEPSPRSSRLVLAGAVATAIVVGGAGFLLGRGTTKPTVIVAPPIAAPTPVQPSPPVRGVLGRADLIALAGQAADAAAGGPAARAAMADADGRRFEIRLPFGCEGPSEKGSEAPMRWRYDEGAKALRLYADPVRWTAADWGAGDAGVDVIEGFWITRPWTSSEACPTGGERPVAQGSEPVTLPGQTLAIGQVFASGDARDGKRVSKPYEAVIRVAEDPLRVSEGFRLRLRGRVARTGDAGLVRCRQPAGPEQRPICLISVVMDEVAIENPATGEALATWSISARQALGG